MTALEDLVSEAAGSLTSVLWISLALRATWLLPDWLIKWQRLLGRRRAGRMRARGPRRPDATRGRRHPDR